MLGFGTVRFLNALTGDPIGEIAGTDVLFSMNHAGTRFASVADNRVRIWDLTTGQLMQDFSTPTISSSTPIWISDNYIAMRQYVFSVKKGTFIYRYDMPEPTTPPTDRFCIHIPARASSSPELSIISPSIAVLEQAESKLRDEDLYAASRGSKVSLEVNIEAPQEMRDASVEAIKKKLAENGMTVADGQPVKLVMSTEAGKSEEKVYLKQETGEKQKVTINPLVSKATFMVNDKPAWTASQSSGGSFMYRTGKSLEEQIAADREASVGNFFRAVHLPEKVPAAIDLKSLPSSQLK